MAWYDVGIWVMIAVVAVPFLYILAGLIRMIAEAIQDRKTPKKPVPPDREIETEFGTFKRERGIWSREIRHRGYDLSITVEDVDDAPDTAFLARLPEILRNLGAYEASARELIEDRVEANTTPDEPAVYTLDGIGSSDDEDVDFVLTFNFDTESWGESVYVDFKNGKATNYMTVD